MELAGCLIDQGHAGGRSSTPPRPSATACAAGAGRRWSRPVRAAAIALRRPRDQPQQQRPADRDFRPHGDRSAGHDGGDAAQVRPPGDQEAAGVPRLREDALGLRREVPGADPSQDRAHPPRFQPARRRHRALFLHESQRAADPRHQRFPQLLRRRARLQADHLRLFAGGAAHPGSAQRGSRPSSRPSAPAATCISSPPARCIRCRPTRWPSRCAAPPR